MGLWELLEGRKNLEILAEEHLKKVLKDPRIRNRLLKVDLDRLKIYEIDLLEAIVSDFSLPEPPLQWLVDYYMVTRSEAEVAIKLFQKVGKKNKVVELNVLGALVYLLWGEIANLKFR